MRIYSHLATASADPGKPVDCPPEAIIPVAHAFCQEVYPDLLHPSRNSGGTWFNFSPGSILPTSVYIGLFLVFLLVSLVMFTMGLRAGAPQFFGLLAVLVGLSLAGAVIVSLIKSDRSMRFRHQRPMRKQLASIVAVREGLGPGALGWLPGDDRALSFALQRFLAEHRVSYRRPLFGPKGEYLFADSAKVGRIARLLTKLVARGRDNEMFVLMIDVLEAMDHWPELLQAIKLARARRHQVAFVCPWPEGLPPPDSAHAAPLNFGDLELMTADNDSLRLALESMDEQRFQHAYSVVAQQLGRIGVCVVCAASGDAVPILLSRIEQVRAARAWP
jgi:hypothetical protein